LKYRAEIDGLRAFAVLPVILFHAGFELFSGGFIGVDVFFVISGYLITSIIIEDIESKRFSIVDFYERRARRILPALSVVVFFTAVVGWLILNPIELYNFGNAMLGVATFTSNIVFWKSQGYFDESAELNPLLHTWSLAVEEQYYVFFPIFLIMAWRFGRSTVFWTIVVFTFVSLALSEWGWRNSPAANFYLAPTRAWELFAGSIATFIVQKRGVRANDFLSLFGLAAVLFSIFAYSESTPFPSVYALVPVIGVVLLILFAGQNTLAAKLLSTKLFVGIGLVSYSAYLWHQPLFAFFRKENDAISIPAPMAFLLVFLTLLLGYLSWRYVEAPFRNRNVISKKKLTIFSVLSLVAIGCLGLLSRDAAEGFEYRLAADLAKSDFVYFYNLNERKFVASRLALPLKPENTVVMGSSRIMQVGSRTLKDTTINFSVSGATIKDDVSFIGEAVSKLSPSRVLIGADPWLMNREDKDNRWKSVEYLWAHWAKLISLNVDLESENYGYFSSNRKYYAPREKFSATLYDSINLGEQLIAKDGENSIVGKKAYDGFHIYDKQYISTEESEIVSDFDRLLNYKINNYKHDANLELQFRALVSWLVKNGIEVHLVLSPYHPELYERMIQEKPIYLSLETMFKQIGNDLGVNVIGSYDPNVVGCVVSDFYDGMHPKELCMEKVLSSILK
jgi:peptidoglycan/LPS O-acetylase OafA/YrhL